MTKQILLCLTNSPLHAHQVVDWLKQEGFPPRDISACLPEKNVTFHAAPRAGHNWSVSCGRPDESACARHVTVLGQKLLKSAKAAKKSLVDSASLTSFLMAKGLSEPVARRCEVQVKEGGIVLSVHTGSRSKLQRAKEILELAGTQNIAEIAAGRRPAGCGQPLMA